MDGSSAWTPGQRNRLLDLYRGGHAPSFVRLRAHTVLPLADGHAWALAELVIA